jgi:hypothetical protein
VEIGDILNIGISPEEAKIQTANLLKEKIIVGHGVGNDLLAIDLPMEPHRVRDTAWYPQFLKRMGSRTNFDPWLKHTWAAIFSLTANFIPAKKMSWVP